MAKETLDTEGVRQMMLAVAEAIIAAEPELTDADRNLGDGDHGIGMERGLTAAKEKLEAGGFEAIGKVVSAVGMAMMTSMGGAMSRQLTCVALMTSMGGAMSRQLTCVALMMSMGGAMSCLSRISAALR